MGTQFASNMLAHEQGLQSVLLSHYIDQTAFYPLVSIRLEETPGLHTDAATKVSNSPQLRLLSLRYLC
jgi:hypothetical protein